MSTLCDDLHAPYAEARTGIPGSERVGDRSSWHDAAMTRRRIVVGAVGDGDEALAVARTLRDAGREVVLAGGGQSPEQLIHTALAEDADELVVCGDVDLSALESVRDLLGAQHVRLTAAAGVTDPTRQDPL